MRTILIIGAVAVAIYLFSYFSKQNTAAAATEQSSANAASQGNLLGTIIAGGGSLFGSMISGLSNAFSGVTTPNTGTGILDLGYTVPVTSSDFALPITTNSTAIAGNVSNQLSYIDSSTGDYIGNLPQPDALLSTPTSDTNEDWLDSLYGSSDSPSSSMSSLDSLNLGTGNWWDS